MNSSIDLITLLVAVGLLALVVRAAVRTRSALMRVVLVGFALVMIALMLWNLAVHGGLHAV
jgi:inner membrane protein involved in colicin E2 resistance